jgi:ribonuclease BN (tRNA processing enzyme)
VIVYSGDSAWTDDFVQQTRGADLFLCECSTYETRLSIHVSYPEIARARRGSRLPPSRADAPRR